MNSAFPGVSGTTSSGLSRRGLLTAGLATALPWPTIGHAQSTGPIHICQSADLSGPLAEIGLALQTGAKLCFNAVNAKGGVHGRNIELETRDDGYTGKRAQANVAEFLADQRTFALFNCVGTPVMEAVLPQVLESGVPFFAPYSGATLPSMKTARNVFVIRASYADEAEKLVNHLATVGIKRVGIVYQNNAFGEDVFENAKAAIKRQKMDEPPSAKVESSGVDAVQAATALAAAEPQALLIALSGKPAELFVKAIRTQRRGLPLFALSVLATSASLKALGADASGISLSQVVPALGSVAIPVVRDFLRDWKASGNKLDPSSQALEGYINARVFVEALNRAGRNPTRAAFIDATWKIRRHDVGGFEVTFVAPGQSASNYVELAMARKDGTLIR